MIITPITIGSNSPKSPLTNIRLSKALEQSNKTKSRSFTVMENAHSQYPTVPKLIKQHKEQSVEYFKKYLQEKVCHAATQKKQLQNNRRCLLMDKVRKAQQQKQQRQASNLARKAIVERKLIEAEFMREKLRKNDTKQKKEAIHSDLMLKLRSFDRHFQKYSTVKQPAKFTLQYDGYQRLKTEMIERQQKLMETYSNRLKSLEEKGEHLKNRLSFLEKLYSD